MIKKSQNLVNLVCERPPKVNSTNLVSCIHITPWGLLGHSATTWTKFYPILTASVETSSGKLWTFYITQENSGLVTKDSSIALKIFAILISIDLSKSVCMIYSV